MKTVFLYHSIEIKHSSKAHTRAPFSHLIDIDMDWSKKKSHLFDILRNRLRNFHFNKQTYLTFDSHLPLPILLINPISMTVASTQTPGKTNLRLSRENQFPDD